MIKLQKVEEPDILKTNAALWLQALYDKLNAGIPPTDAEKGRYRHIDIKEALKSETHGKCAYCESILLHVAFGDVEHIAPKSLKLADTFRWENLTLACDVCNTYKRDAAGLVDPYVDDPDEYFEFMGPMIYAHPDKQKGVATKTKLRLNRIELVASRLRRLDSIASLIAIIKHTDDAAVRQILFDDLITNEAGDHGEYAAFVRSFIKSFVSQTAVSQMEP